MITVIISSYRHFYVYDCRVQCDDSNISYTQSLVGVSRTLCQPGVALSQSQPWRWSHSWMHWVMCHKSTPILLSQLEAQQGSPSGGFVIRGSWTTRLGCLRLIFSVTCQSRQAADGRLTMAMPDIPHGLGAPRWLSDTLLLLNAIQCKLPHNSRSRGIIIICIIIMGQSALGAVIGSVVLPQQEFLSLPFSIIYGWVKAGMAFLAL